MKENEVFETCDLALKAFDSLMGEFVGRGPATDWGTVNEALINLEKLRAECQTEEKDDSISVLL